MKNPLKSFSMSHYLSGLLLMLLGLFLMTGGQVGFQVAEKAPHWIPIPKLEQTWMAWLVVWFGFDSIFNYKITNYVLSKTVIPILKSLPVVQRLAERIKKKKEEQNGIRE